jgi:hypothetical protein
MIHLGSWDLGDISARLCDHDETINIASQDAELDLFMSPRQAFQLTQSLLRCLQDVRLDDDEGVSQEFRAEYAQIRQLQEAKAFEAAGDALASRPQAAQVSERSV